MDTSCNLYNDVLDSWAAGRSQMDPFVTACEQLGSSVIVVTRSLHFLLDYCLLNVPVVLAYTVFADRIHWILSLIVFKTCLVLFIRFLWQLFRVYRKQSHLYLDRNIFNEEVHITRPQHITNMRLVERYVSFD
jgi:hypothetical protein